MAKKNKLASLVSNSPSQAECARPYKQSAEDKARDLRYKAEDGLRTLTRAKEIERNKPLMKAIKQVAREQIKTTEAVIKRK